jgi:hypothetical protein
MVKTGGAANFIRKTSDSPSSSLRMTLLNVTGYADENIIRFHALGSPDFDPSQDALKINGSTLNLSMLSSAGDRLCINTVSRPKEEPLRLPLSVGTNQAGNLRLQFSQFGEDAQALNLYLVDHYLQTTTQIQEGDVYAFSITADSLSNVDGRLELVFTELKDVPVLKITSESKISGYQKTGVSETLFLKGENLNPNEGVLSIFTASGQKIYTERLQNLSDYQVPIRLKTGVYFVNWVQGNSHLKTKVFVQE